MLLPSQPMMSWGESMCEGSGERVTKTVSAEEFELNCLEMIDLVAEKGFTNVITKDGKPFVMLERVKVEAEAAGAMD